MSFLHEIQTCHCSPEEVEIPFPSVCRYLGLGKSLPDENLTALIENSIMEFKKAVRYTACYKVVSVSVAADSVDFGILNAPGKSLAKHLVGCDQAILFAATVGMETERQRKRAVLSSPAKALALDAVGTAAIESFCDVLCRNRTLEYSDRMLRPRFSPGYGDLPLALQKPLLELLDANRLAGISLTEALLMIPQKSVSAIVGIGKTGCTAKKSDCTQCSKTDCAFRL